MENAVPSQGRTTAGPSCEGREGNRECTPLTWEEVDEALECDRLTQLTHMREKTSYRRLYALVSAYSFVHTYMTRRERSGGHEWCSRSACAGLLRGLSETQNVMKERVASYRTMLDEAIIEERVGPRSRVDADHLKERLEELSDPDKKIWKRFYEEGVEPEKVVEAYKQVRELLPGKPVENYEFRRGPVEGWRGARSTVSDGTLIGALGAGDAGEGTQPSYLVMTSDDFYDEYVRSDMTVAKSNKLCEAYSESYDLMPGISVRIPRRMDRYFTNVETASAIKNNTRFPTNFAKGMVCAYTAGGIFGGAFSATQLYLMDFSRAVSAACEGVVQTATFSKIKSQASNKSFLSGEWQRNGNKACAYPLCLQSGGNSWAHPQEDTGRSRRQLVEAFEFAPSRTDRKSTAAVAGFMKSVFAEEDPDGPAATWLAYTVSRVLGRRVDPHYALVFIINWTAAQFRDSGRGLFEDALRGFHSSVGLAFCPERGLFLPMVSFGSGMTNRKLRSYTLHIMLDVVQALLDKGVVHEGEDEDEDEGEGARLSLEEASRSFFRNNNVVKRGEGEDDGCKGGRGLTATAGDLAAMKGQVFLPNHRREAIKEEEYTLVLNRGVKLGFRFGVCGYQHPLGASNKKENQVTTQLIKHRQIYAQRESAAAANWDRLLQFLFPGSSIDAEAKAELSLLSRHFVEAASREMRLSLSCERVLNDLAAKFNCEMLPLGLEPDAFLRTKAGLVIGGHARRAMETAHHRRGEFAESEAAAATPVADIAKSTPLGHRALELARACVTAAHASHHYENVRPFLQTEKDDSFRIIPLFGIDNPIFPAPKTYKDNTAERFTDSDSQFWIEQTNENFLEALVRRRIVSAAMLYRDDNLRAVGSPSSRSVDIYRALQAMNLAMLDSEKPRKHDPKPWSSKNTGQTGRNTIEFSPNSVITLTHYEDADSFVAAVPRNPHRRCRLPPPGREVTGNSGRTFRVGGEGDVYLAGVENQKAMAQQDIVYPQYTVNRETGREMILATDICPLFRHGGKPAVLPLKHSNNTSRRVC